MIKALAISKLSLEVPLGRSGIARKLSTVGSTFDLQCIAINISLLLIIRCQHSNRLLLGWEASTLPIEPSMKCLCAKCLHLKGVGREIFEPICAPDKQAEVFLNMVSISPRYSITKLSPRCATYRGAEINCTLRKQNRILHLSKVAFKETIRRNPFRGKRIYHERKDMKYNMLVCVLLMR